MKVLVCMKQTPDTEASIKIAADGKGIEEQNIKWIMSPYDEYAVEEAIRIKEKQTGETVVVTVGTDRVVESMRTALAMGIDRGVHCVDPAFLGSDALATAKILASVIKTENPDVVLCGRQAIDLDQAQAPAYLAEILGWPQVYSVAKLELKGNAAVCNRRIEGGEEIVETSLPCVMTCDKGLNEPRYASLPGIMKAKKKEIKKWALAQTGLAETDVGTAGAKVKTLGYLPLPDRPPGKVFKEMETADMVKQVVKLLREEAKVI